MRWPTPQRRDRLIGALSGDPREHHHHGQPVQDQPDQHDNKPNWCRPLISVDVEQKVEKAETEKHHHGRKPPPSQRGGREVSGFGVPLHGVRSPHGEGTHGLVARLLNKPQTGEGGADARWLPVRALAIPATQVPVLEGFPDASRSVPQEEMPPPNPQPEPDQQPDAMCPPRCPEAPDDTGHDNAAQRTSGSIPGERQRRIGKSPGEPRSQGSRGVSSRLVGSSDSSIWLTVQSLRPRNEVEGPIRCPRPHLRWRYWD